MVAISGLDGDQGKDQWQALPLAGAGELARKEEGQQEEIDFRLSLSLGLLFIA